MESRMARIEVEVKKISTIEASIEELRSEVKTAIRGMARKCDELFLQHMGFTSTILREQQIGAYSNAKVSDPSNIGLFEELMTPGVPQSPDLIATGLDPDASTIADTKLRTSDPSSVSDFILRHRPSTMATRSRQHYRGADLRAPRCGSLRHCPRSPHGHLRFPHHCHPQHS
ncbi:hypothetical protein Scep_024365 [Stephania cephalantha]|uniref:Uncharacterized protein n=1 Tax=Stephania cephalantha TaxID=152367 RepID=A0AAP0HYD9_9MAGN